MATDADRIIDEARAAVDNPPYGHNLASNAYVLGLLKAVDIIEHADPHPEHAWVWADGNYFDAVVIHREWAAYHRMYMEAQPGYWASDGERHDD